MRGTPRPQLKQFPAQNCAFTAYTSFNCFLSMLTFVVFLCSRIFQRSHTERLLRFQSWTFNIGHVYGSRNFASQTLSVDHVYGAHFFCLPFARNHPMFWSMCCLVLACHMPNRTTRLCWAFVLEPLADNCAYFYIALIIILQGYATAATCVLSHI